VTSPAITGASGEDVREMAPPPERMTSSHLWPTSTGRRDPGPVDLYISKLAEEKMRNHALSTARERKEVMGFMLGSVYEHEGARHVLVRDVATAGLEATDVHVRFSQDAFEDLFAQLDDAGFRYILVGWYHSHPSYGCFMSSIDIQTQRTFFNRPYHSALVIDPVKREIDVFKLSGGKVESRPFLVYWEPFQDPYGIGGRRKWR